MQPGVHTPNEIWPEDWNGWIQELLRQPGDPAYVPQGHYIYMGLAFFRQFPPECLGLTGCRLPNYFVTAVPFLAGFHRPVSTVSHSPAFTSYPASSDARWRGQGRSRVAGDEVDP